MSNFQLVFTRLAEKTYICTLFSATIFVPRRTEYGQHNKNGFIL